MPRGYILAIAIALMSGVANADSDNLDSKPAINVEFDGTRRVTVNSKKQNCAPQQETASTGEVTFEPQSSDFTPFGIGLIVVGAVVGAGLGVYGKFKNETSK